MSSDETPAIGYEVGVAIIPVLTAGGVDQKSIAPPGYEDTLGMRGRHATESRSRVVALGGEAVRVATEELAKQVAVTARRFAETLEQEAVTSPAPGRLGVESVEISFGVTLTGGVQALFTAQGESSAQVTISLSRRPTS